MKPKLIVFEGIDGSGKSTLIQKLSRQFDKMQILHKCYNEPTNYEHGQLIRKFLRKEIELNKIQQIQTFLDDRVDSVQQNIQPSLSQGYHVLLDRYYFSMAAYQGDDEYPPKKIVQMNREKNFPTPDYLFYLNLSIDDAMIRIQKRRGEKEYFEDWKLLENIQKNFLQVLPNTTHILDAMQSEEKLLFDVMNILELNSI